MTFLILISRDIQAGPLEPEQAKQTFKTADSLNIELVAAEPEVIDPVSFAFDEQGRLWVVEMRDYPNGPAEGEAGTSRIKILYDTDQDGYYDQSHVFADQLLFATSLLPWKGGVIVTLAGQVEWMIDRDGDNRVDQREVWLEGFAQENPQLRANHPTLGPDGWIYLSNGLRGGEVRVVHPQWPQPENTISLRGKDFRFHPHTGACEAIAGNGQYGSTIDAWGNRIICSNRNPAMQVMLQFDQLASQPLLTVPSLVNDISPSGEDSRLSPLTGNWTTSNLHQGQFTAACGVLIYHGQRLPSRLNQGVLTCDPTANLIHADEIKFSGSSFQAVKPHQDQEFLASTDGWFRPVNLKLGPDGSLYLADMYRAVIEHPQFMPEELKQRPDLTLGNDRGRIWRVSDPRQLSANVAAFGNFRSDDQLISALLSDNAWARDTAFRIIYSEQKATITARLEALISQSNRAAAIASGLSLLDLSDAIDDISLATYCVHEEPLVRQRALKIAERRLQAANGNLSAIAAVLKGVVIRGTQDAHPLVRYQAVLTSRFLNHSEPLLPRLIGQSLVDHYESTDSWQQKAALLACSDQLEGLLLQILELKSETADTANGAAVQFQIDFVEEICQLAGKLNQPELTAKILSLLWKNPELTLSVPVQAAVIRGLGTGLVSRRTSLDTYLQSTAMEGKKWQELEAYQQTVLQLTAYSQNYAKHADSIYAAIKFLPDVSLTNLMLTTALDATAHPSARTAAFRALAGRPLENSQQTAENIVASIRSETPLLRREMIDFCLSNTDATRLMLIQMEAGKLKYRELAVDQVRRISYMKDQQILEIYARLQQQLKASGRDEVIARYQQSLHSAPLNKEQSLRGLDVFRQNCATCHRMGAEGVQVGPDISDTRTKKPDELLVNILDPNKAIDNNYFSYTAVTTEGKIATGILAEETPFAITLKQAKGEAVTLQREEIEEFSSDGISFMPAGLEKNITPAQMIDLIAYLKNWRYLDGEIPLN